MSIKDKIQFNYSMGAVANSFYKEKQSEESLIYPAVFTNQHIFHVYACASSGAYSFQ